jgi:AMP-binding enzyme C-terminal domain
VVQSSAAFADVEAVLGTHPRVRECAVTEIDSAPGRTTLVAYVVEDGDLEADELRSFLSERMLARLIPQAVIPVPSLPRGDDGEVDYDGLPLPVQDGAAVGGKGAGSLADGGYGCGLVLATLPVAVLAFALTGVFWPHSIDLSGVSQPWAALFVGLYVCECLAFGLGVVFLFAGRRLMRARGRSPGFVHLAVVWLLVAWWPQDNFYRLASKTDWPRQAILVYAFNISLMIAAAVVVGHLVAKPKTAGERRPGR